MSPAGLSQALRGPDLNRSAQSAAGGYPRTLIFVLIAGNEFRDYKKNPGISGAFIFRPVITLMLVQKILENGHG